MTTEAKKEKAILVVISAATAHEPVAGNPVIQFKAKKHGEESEKLYETWGTDLVNLVKVGAALNCEIAYVEKDGVTKNRVTQMFDEKGNPVKKTSRAGSGSRGHWGQTDEQVRIERISIEGQTAYNGIIELLKVGVIKKEDEQGKKALEFAMVKMNAAMASVSHPAKPLAEVKPPIEAEKGEKAKATEIKPPSSETPKTVSPPITATMIQQISKIAKEKGYTQETLRPLVLFFGVQMANDLTVEQGNQLLQKVKKGEGLPVKTEQLI